MIEQSNYSKVHLVAEIFITVLLLVVIGLLTYEVFKPPLVSKNTIEELKQSASVIESYTKELQVIASLSRQQVNEDDVVSRNEKSERDGSYDDLLSRYGIFDNDKSSVHTPSPVANGNDGTNGVREAAQSN